MLLFPGKWKNKTNFPDHQLRPKTEPCPKHAKKFYGFVAYSQNLASHKSHPHLYMRITPAQFGSLKILYSMNKRNTSRLLATLSEMNISGMLSLFHSSPLASKLLIFLPKLFHVRPISSWCNPRVRIASAGAQLGFQRNNHTLKTLSNDMPTKGKFY